MNGPLASRLPGRLRRRDKALRSRMPHESLMAEFRGWPGVASVEGNVATGSILLHYDVGQVSQADLEAKVVAAVAVFVGAPRPAVAKEPVASKVPAPVRAEAPAYRRKLARQLNRYSKIGMMVSLPLSLAALAANKRVHAAAGSLFVVLMLVHMAVHRRHLLK